MNNKQNFINYLTFLEGATPGEAEETYENIQNMIADGESRVDILDQMGLPLDLIDLL